MELNPRLPSIQKCLNSLLAYDATEIFMGSPKPEDPRPGPALKRLHRNRVWSRSTRFHSC